MECPGAMSYRLWCLWQTMKLAYEDEEEREKAYHPKPLSTQKYTQLWNPSDVPVIQITVDVIHQLDPDDFKEEVLPHISDEDRKNLFGTCTDDQFCIFCTLELGYFY